MPIRRMNFTSRMRLTREHANVTIHPPSDPGAPATFDVELDLAHLRPAADAGRVFVEAFHQTTRMRFDFGTVAAPVSPPPPDRRLHEFPDWRDVRFRVKITDVTECPGRILAWANRIKPKAPDDRDENDLVRFRDAELYGLLWDIEFDDDGPVVLIERSAGGAQRVARSDSFIAAVYPQILRLSLEKALIHDKAAHDDQDHWLHLWYEGYLKTKLGMPAPPPVEQEEARRNWIAEAVSAFGRRFQIVRHWPTEEPQLLGGHT